MISLKLGERLKRMAEIPDGSGDSGYFRIASGRIAAARGAVA